MIRKMKLCLWVWVGCLFLAPNLSWAQPKGTLLPDKVKWKTKKKDGWFPNVDASFNFSFAQSDGVIGVPNGTTLNFGLQLKGGLVYSSGPHEWRNSLLLLHTQTKLPTINSFLKSADKVDVESTYTYRFSGSKWFGLFGSLKAETALLPGFIVQDSDASASIKEIDGTIKTDAIKAQTPFNLTAGFAPFLFKQSLGVSLTPHDKSSFRLNFKVGGGAVEAWTQKGLRINDDAGTANVVELERMQDYVQLGAEARVSLNGILFDKMLNYSLKAGAMLPFFTSVPTTLSFDQLINFDVTFKLGIKIFQWLRINYSLAMLLVPLIQPKVQVTNNLVLSFTWSIL